MAAESNARSLEESDISIRMDLEGLEEIFLEHEELFSRGLTLKQAVYYYGETRTALKVKVEDGSIPAIRMPKEQGHKWRVFPDGVPEPLEKLIPKKLRKKNEALDESAARDKSVKSDKRVESDAIALKPVRKEKKKSAAAKKPTAQSRRAAGAPGLVQKRYESIEVETTEPDPISLETFAADFFGLKTTEPDPIELDTTEPDPISLDTFTPEPIELEITEPALFEPGSTLRPLPIACCDGSPAVLTGVPPAPTSDLIDLDLDLADSDLAFAYIQDETTAAAPTAIGRRDAGAPGLVDGEPGLLNEVPGFADDYYDPSAELPPLPEIDFELPSVEPSQMQFDPSVPELARSVFVLDNTSTNAWRSYLDVSPQMSFAPHSDFAIFAEMPAPQASTTEAILEEENKLSLQYEALEDKVCALEDQLAKAMLRNDYLETKLHCLEDQMKFLTQSHYHSRGFNKLILLIPAAALLAAIFLFRFGTFVNPLN